jgi:hypothetical protein
MELYFSEQNQVDFKVAVAIEITREEVKEVPQEEELFQVSQFVSTQEFSQSFKVRCTKCYKYACSINYRSELVFCRNT